MERVPLITKDGSHTISIPAMNVTYHSIHGAIQESMHVFINAGLRQLDNISPKDIRILEIGLGTGLNALLTLIDVEQRPYFIKYTAIELFPLGKNEINLLNFCVELKRKDLELTFYKIHESDWEKEVVLSNNFTLIKKNSSLQAFQPDLTTNSLFHLIYFDAFGPGSQPELWTEEIFSNLLSALTPGGILVTYCSKGDVRRAMEAAGFLVEKIPGPPGKREMVRARKSS